ncbi:4'-phosphopantetheinyl transferase superfamily protein [Fictibacillus sp. KIGAM418]|uniref:4'-phosphopantetheinyl transferase superfamily protein n=1 Tax=Fictibacillus marinisediminis TaxID=2878389 RepID=A0A9X2BGZ5_9BACL|nr:4'-phosphopantetheinyl transferase superfamily protein [Fictibacillus marinisediminis]MCK6258777.1 4'-phosphopantetheinyl transferase superfamily protein [Fictibacillus marinisediminis]
MMQIYAVPIVGFPDRYFPHLLPFVTEERKQRLFTFSRREDCLRGLLAELLIRKIASDTFAVPVKSILFELTDFGKPSLKTPLNKLHYNISHSGNWVVCITDECTVGIDIEKKNAIDLQIARQFFAQEEYDYIEGNWDEQQKQERFFEVWTAKESYIKAIGKGLSIPLNSFSTVRQGNVEGLRVFEHENWYLKTYLLDSEYALTACSQSNKFCESVQIMPIDSLVSYFLNS